MSDLGYRNSAQANLVVSANSLEEYVRDLYQATHAPRPEFERIGVKVAGEYRQLNANQLQIENEFYSTIRPKRVTRPGERPTAALRRGGVQYIELRALDISPWDPVGINQRQLRFLEVFLIYCLLQSSPPISAAEQERIDRNHGLVARRGREPGLAAGPRRRERAPAGLGRPHLQRHGPGRPAHRSRRAAGPRGGNPLPAAGRRGSGAHALGGASCASCAPRGRPWRAYGLELAGRTRDYFRSLAPELNRHRELLETEAETSLAKQAQIEAADDVPFDEYLARYLA